MAWADLVELRARYTLDGNAPLLRNLETLRQRAFLLRAFGHNELEDIAPTGAQTLVNRVTTVNQLAHVEWHRETDQLDSALGGGSSVIRRNDSAKARPFSWPVSAAQRRIISAGFQSPIWLLC